MNLSRVLAAVCAGAVSFARDPWPSHVSWRDIVDLMSKPAPVGRLPGDPLVRLGVSSDELVTSAGPAQFVRKTQYLNGASAVVTHTVDDSTLYMPTCLDAMDKYGIKATAFVDTRVAGQLRPALWPRLQQAVDNGHEIGAHSRRHRCCPRETGFFCFLSVNRYEITGARDDILEQTNQPYVWSWAYPCGNCAFRRFVQRRVERAGYVAARAHQEVPDLHTYDANLYAIRFTQVVQKSYIGVDQMMPGRSDVREVNAKFDEVHAAGGIYSFLSHPQRLDYGPDGFYERHLAYIGGRKDVWYVPTGPLYAYRVLFDHTSVRQLASKGARARFVVFHRLDPDIFNGSITLEFQTSAPVEPVAGGQKLPERAAGPVRRWDGQYYRRLGDNNLLLTVRPGTIIEFR